MSFNNPADSVNQKAERDAPVPLKADTATNTEGKTIARKSRKAKQKRSKKTNAIAINETTADLTLNVVEKGIEKGQDLAVKQVQATAEAYTQTLSQGYGMLYEAISKANEEDLDCLHDVESAKLDSLGGSDSDLPLSGAAGLDFSMLTAS